MGVSRTNIALVSCQKTGGYFVNGMYEKCLMLGIYVLWLCECEMDTKYCTKIPLHVFIPFSDSFVLWVL